MDLSSWRDVILIIWGLAATITMVFIAVLMFLFYRRTVSVMESTDAMVAKVSNMVEYVDAEVVQPVSRLGAVVKGIIQGISIFTGAYKK